MNRVLAIGLLCAALSGCATGADPTATQDTAASPTSTDVPDVEQIVASLEAAEESPPKAHMQIDSTVRMTMVVPDSRAIEDAVNPAQPTGPGDLSIGAMITMTITTDTEQWTDGTGRLRAESTMTIDVDMPEGDFGSGMASAMFGAMFSETSGLVVNDGEHVWSYTSMLDTYTKLDDDSDLFASGGDLSAFGWTQPFAYRGVEGYDYELTGTESFVGRTVYGLTAAPKEGAATEPVMGMYAINELDLLVDAETGQVLRSEADMRLDFGDLDSEDPDEPQGNDIPGMTARWVTEATMVDFDPELSDELFTFEPPEGATELDAETLDALSGIGDDLNVDATRASDLPEVETLDEAAEHVSFPVLQPAELPATCQLSEVDFTPLLSFEHDPDVFVMSRYACDTGPVTISQAPSGAELTWSVGTMAVEMAERYPEDSGTSADVHAATVGGHPAVVTSIDSARWVTWDTGETLVEVHGFLDEATLLQVAESMR